MQQQRLRWDDGDVEIWSGNEQQEKDEGLPEGELTVLNNPIDTKTGKRGAHCPLSRVSRELQATMIGTSATWHSAGVRSNWGFLSRRGSAGNPWVSKSLGCPDSSAYCGTYLIHT